MKQTYDERRRNFIGEYYLKVSRDDLEVMDGQLYSINEESGEAKMLQAVLQEVGTISYTPEQQEAYKKKKEAEQKRLLSRKANEPLGKYFFFTRQELFSNLSPETLTRFIYLATRLEYDGNRFMKSDRSQMTCCDLPEFLGVSPSTAYRFLKEVKDFVKEDEKRLFLIRKDIFKKGTMKSTKNQTYTKFYTNNLRRLYKSVGVGGHKYLGYIFKMIPYMNVEYNVLCHDSMEEDIEEIKLLSITEFCDLIGYDITHLCKLKKAFGNLVFNNGGTEERFCSITYNGIKNNNARICVNPNILYSGSDFRKVTNLVDFAVSKPL